MRHCIPILIACVSVAACGGSSGTAAAPSATTNSIQVTLESPVKVNATAQATAMATLSNGTTQAITTGWQSDSPSVATASASGVVTGIGNGRATIFVVAGGRQGQQVIRVLPDYQGQWSGNYAISNCQQTGVFITENFCTQVNGGTAPVSMTITQGGESVNGSFLLGSVPFAAFTGPIGADGSAGFTSNNTDATLLINAAWTVNAQSDGRMTGTVRQTWRVSGQVGQGTFDGTIVSMTRGAGARSVGAPARLGTLADAITSVRK